MELDGSDKGVRSSSLSTSLTIDDLPEFYTQGDIEQFASQFSSGPVHMPSLVHSSGYSEASFSGISSLSESISTTAATAGTSSSSFSSPPISSNSNASTSADESDLNRPIKEEENIQAAADSNSQKSFVPCKVCGDRASGFHYGVTSCEGCKGFFRRSIQKQIEYRCLRDGKCMVIRLNRNRCQYCRFKKCLAVGMSRDSVRYGRVPKRSKSQDEQNVTSTDPNLDQSAIENKQLAIYDIILNISQSHHANCGVTEDKLKTLQRKPSTLMQKIHIPSTPVQFSDEELELQKLSMWHCLAALITPAINSVVEFAKRVTGFTDLNQDDQLILIKCGFFEVWLTRMSRMFNKFGCNFTFEDGSVIQKDEMAVVFSPDFVNCMFELAQSFNQLNLNDTEIGLFCAIVLATPDRRGLEDPKAVERIQDKLIEALKLQICRNHSTEENLFGTTIVKLPQLRSLGVQHNEILQWYRAQWHRIRLPPLFSEIYDICKHEDDM